MTSGVLIDILLCLMTYTILMAIILWNRQKGKNLPKDNNDDEGGITAWTGPDLDLPPGISWPSDGPTLKKEVLEDTPV